MLICLESLRKPCSVILSVERRYVELGFPAGFVYALLVSFLYTLHLLILGLSELICFNGIILFSLNLSSYNSIGGYINLEPVSLVSYKRQFNKAYIAS